MRSSAPSIQELLRTRRLGTFAREGELLRLPHDRDDLDLVAGWYLLVEQNGGLVMLCRAGLDDDGDLVAGGPAEPVPISLLREMETFSVRAREPRG